MNRKLLLVAIGFLALTVIVGAPFVPVSSAAPGQSAAAAHHKPAGLTAHGIELARKAGQPSPMVKMAPQSNLQLLSRASKLGPHAPKSTIRLTIGLKLRNEAKLKSFLQQVQNPHSAVYRQWLTPRQFTELYGPSKASVAQVVKFLKAHGIKVKNVSANRILIHTEATAAAYEHAFGIRINDYKLNGRRFYSTTDSPKLPRVLAPLVVNVLGLNHGQQMHPHLYQRPLMNAHGLNPRQAPPASLTQLSPLQIATAYNVPDITQPQAQGVNIAIITAESQGVGSSTDFSDFWSAFGLPDHTINVINIDGSPGTGGEGETWLDIEYSGAMGPAATINVYMAADPGFDTFTDAYNQMVEDNTSDVMTTSWGLYESGTGQSTIETDEQIFMQAAAQGISMFAAAGDAGASDGGPGNNNADYPASSAYVTAANGTQLTVSDLAGDYGSEVVWNDSDCFGNGPGATGGGISQYIDKPGWQTGPGVPADIDERMTSDVALTASCSKPMLIMQGGQWFVSAGTSAVAPQLAGIFAQAIARNGDRLGNAGPLIYGDVNAGNYASDFHDVTDGCNGELSDGSPSCAGTNWDHPTGWGSLNVTSLISHIGIQGPKGTLAGTVTAAASGSAVAGAIVDAVDNDTGKKYGVTTQSDGTYSRLLPVGSFTVTVTAYGYKKSTTDVTISDGDTITKNFALNVAPRVKVRGRVTDGSGHGYGLYAEISVSTENNGKVAEVWTDPSTGQYSVKLPKGAAYTLNAAAAFDGYNTASADVTLSDEQTKNFVLTVTSACTAPGYTLPFTQDFNGASFPPDGWIVTNPIDGNVTWQPSSGEPYNNGNYTGGTGDAADADSGVYNNFGDPFDTSLVSPPIAVSTLTGEAMLRYKANFQPVLNGGGAELDLDISKDDGDNWITISRWTTPHGGVYDLPGYDAQVDLASYLPVSGSFQLRWRYYNLAGGFDYYAQIDDVAIGSCQPLLGGLVFGQAKDGNTGAGVVGTHVVNDKGQGADTVKNPADSNLPVGFYEFFSSVGDHTLTATATNYMMATAQINMSNNAVVKQNFSLKAGRIEDTPDSFTMHVMVNNSATAALALNNVGTGTAMFHVFPINAPPPPTGAHATPVRRVRLSGRQSGWANKSMFWLRVHTKRHGAGRPWKGEGSRRKQASPGGVAPWYEESPHASAWMNVTDYPIMIGDNAAAYDIKTGKLYSVAGFNNVGTGATAAFVYDPNTKKWSAIPGVPVGREAPIAAFINGKLYVAGGVGASGSGVTELDIYDPVTSTWSTGAPIPIATYGAASAVLNGKLYIIGGATPSGTGTATVLVYDPASNGWQLAASYPHPDTFLGCGTIKGKIYCAGGFPDTGESYSDGYVYDPGSNQWTPIADINVKGGVGGALYAVANNELLLAGNFVVVNRSEIVATNQVEAYDPVTNSWSSLPNMKQPAARGGGSCGGNGFYAVGGITKRIVSGFTVSKKVQKLSGYACDGIGIPWLTVAPPSRTVKAGVSANVMLTFDGAGREPFTTSRAYLRIGNNTPYGNLIVPLTVTWDPQPVNLVLTGMDSPNPVEKGGNLTYTLVVANATIASNYGAATKTTLTYQLPDAVSYLTGSGDANCTVSTAGSSPAPEVATDDQPETVTCDFGTLGQGASKTVTIAVKAEQAGTLASHFEVAAREPNDSDKSTLDLNTTIVGHADVSIPRMSDATIAAGSNGIVHMAVANAGPDTATDVTLDVSAQGGVKLQSVTPEQGSCTIATDGGFSCDLGNVEEGSQVGLMLTLFGTSAGTATLQGQAITSADDPDQKNNVTSATVTVKVADGGGGGDNGGGGGTLGWLALAALLGLASSAAVLRGAQRRT